MGRPTHVRQTWNSLGALKPSPVPVLPVPGENPARVLLQDMGFSPRLSPTTQRSRVQKAISGISRGEQVKETETQWPGSPAPALSQLGLLLTLQPHCCCSSWGAPRSSARSHTAPCRHSDSGCGLRRPLGKSSGWREKGSLRDRLSHSKKSVRMD